MWNVSYKARISADIIDFFPGILIYKEFGKFRFECADMCKMCGGKLSSI